MAATLLVELLTEELPPKALRLLSETFGESLAAALGDGLLPHADTVRCFATPRRLAVMIPGVLEKAADVRTERTGPSVSAGPEAARGFAKKCGVPVESLEKHQSAKGEVWLARFTTVGAKLKGKILISATNGSAMAISFSYPGEGKIPNSERMKLMHR